MTKTKVQRKVAKQNVSQAKEVFPALVEEVQFHGIVLEQHNKFTHWLFKYDDRVILSYWPGQHKSSLANISQAEDNVPPERAAKLAIEHVRRIRRR
jgi:hypothetical protein